MAVLVARLPKRKSTCNVSSN